MKRMILGGTASGAITLLLLGGAGAGTAAAASSHVAASACPVTIGNDNGTPVVVPSTLSSSSGSTWNPGISAASSASGPLAFTGTDAAGLALVGGGLLAGGLLLLQASRLRRSSPDQPIYPSA